MQYRVTGQNIALDQNHAALTPNCNFNKHLHCVTALERLGFEPQHIREKNRQIAFGVCKGPVQTADWIKRETVATKAILNPIRKNRDE